MMAAAQRNGELIADLPPERPRLREPQVVGIRGLATTNQTRLLGNRFDISRSRIRRGACNGKRRDCRLPLGETMARTTIYPGEHLAEELRELEISAAELARQGVPLRHGDPATSCEASRRPRS